MKKIVFAWIIVFPLLLAAIQISAANASDLVNQVNDSTNTTVQLKDTSIKRSNIKNNLKHESLTKIFNDVINLTKGNIAKLLDQFSSNNPSWIWIVQESKLPENINAFTTFTDEGVVTRLDYQKLNGATRLSVARTIIHEMLHAYLTLYFRNDGINANRDFPLIVLAWATAVDPDYNEIQHAQIELSFVDDITEALNTYGQSIGLSVDQSVYADLAWGGLNFQNNSLLTQTDKKRIQLRLSAEQLNRTIFNVNPVGTKVG